jgi:hypothetical protein
MFIKIALADVSPNGVSPASNSYMITPKAHRSTYLEVTRERGEV